MSQTTESKIYVPHFNKCVNCGQKPNFDHTPLSQETTVSCPGQCCRLYITCIGLELAETLWNTANPVGGNLLNWKREADHQFDLYNLGREIDNLRERVAVAKSVGSAACIDNESTYDVHAFQYISSALSQIGEGLDFLEQEIKK